MDEAQKEVQERIQAFIKEYGELTKKHKVDFVNFPMFTPNDKGSWDIVIQTQPVDTTNQPVKSFIQP